MSSFGVVSCDDIFHVSAAPLVVPVQTIVFRCSEFKDAVLANRGVSHGRCDKDQVLPCFVTSCRRRKVSKASGILYGILTVEANVLLDELWMGTRRR